MEVRELLNALAVAERLKDTTRHCYTSKGRHESVAEHSLDDDGNGIFYEE